MILFTIQHISTLKRGEGVGLVVVLCCYGQGVEKDEEHHQPVKAVCFHIHKTLHPEEAIPATGQATKHRNNTGLVCQAAVNVAG